MIKFNNVVLGESKVANKHCVFMEATPAEWETIKDLFRYVSDPANHPNISELYIMSGRKDGGDYEQFLKRYGDSPTAPRILKAEHFVYMLSIAHDIEDAKIPLRSDAERDVIKQLQNPDFMELELFAESRAYARDL